MDLVSAGEMKLGEEPQESSRATASPDMLQNEADRTPHFKRDGKPWSCPFPNGPSGQTTDALNVARRD